MHREVFGPVVIKWWRLICHYRSLLGALILLVFYLSGLLNFLISEVDAQGISESPDVINTSVRTGLDDRSFCTIDGRVFDKNGQAVSLAEVRLYRPDRTLFVVPGNPCLTDCGVSRSGGYFTFSGVPPQYRIPDGRYLLIARKTGSSGVAFIDAKPGDNYVEITISGYECLPTSVSPPSGAVGSTSNLTSGNDLMSFSNRDPVPQNNLSPFPGLINVFMSLIVITVGTSAAVYLLRK